NWNDRAIGFYQGMGAAILEGWKICRLTEDQLPGIAQRIESPHLEKGNPQSPRNEAVYSFFPLSGN
ncbi:MAG: hypothetical protein ACWGQW_13855, partial [bacterium]